MKRSTRTIAFVLMLVVAFSLSACAAPAASPAPAASAATPAPGAAPAAPTAAPAAPPAANNPVITITSMYFSAETPDNKDFNDALKAITGYETKINWIPSTAFDDKLNTMLASDTMDMITTVSNIKSSAMLGAIADGVFVPVNDYVKQYQNLSKMGDARYKNVTINGNIVGIPRGRDIVRQGVIYRQDWAESIGMTGQPKTLDDLIKMMKEFKATKGAAYGVTAGGQGGYPEGFSYLANYLGSPNEWGMDSKGQFNAMWLTDEFLQSLDYWAGWYKEGLVNKNFVEINAEDGKKLINTEETGLIFVYCDDIANRFADLYIKNPAAKLWYAFEINGRTFGTAGFNGALVINKKATKDEAGVKHALNFIDKLGDPAWQTAIRVGLKDKHFTLVDGVANQTPEQNTAYSATGAQYGQVNCYHGVVNPDVKLNLIPAIMAQNEERLKYVDTTSMNMATPMLSETAAKIGKTDLDPIRLDAINKYVMGVITKAEFEKAKTDWLAAGGQKVIDEYKAQLPK